MLLYDSGTRDSRLRMCPAGHEGSRALINTKGHLQNHHCSCACLNFVSLTPFSWTFYDINIRMKIETKQKKIMLHLHLILILSYGPWKGAIKAWLDVLNLRHCLSCSADCWCIMYVHHVVLICCGSNFTVNTLHRTSDWMLTWLLVKLPKTLIPNKTLCPHLSSLP